MEKQQKIEATAIYTVCEVAGILKSSETVIYSAIKNSKLKSKRIGEGRGVHRILGEWLLDYIAN